MGCDIHFFIEEYKDGTWEFVEEVDIDRNYNLFGVLAGVRTRFWKHFEPKGLPNDVSDIVSTKAIDWDCDGHTHSWLSANELLNYPWYQKVSEKGYVSAYGLVDYLKTKNKTCIYFWDKSNLREVVPLRVLYKHAKSLITLAEQEDFIEQLKEVDSVQSLITVNLAPSYFCSDFIETVLPRFRQNRNLRCVFWFDN